MNREAWLWALTEKIAPSFEQSGHKLPAKLAVSVGFPSRGATSARNLVLGQCWAPEACKDGTIQLFVSPLIAEGSRAGDVLVHELCHAVLPSGTGHNGTFAALARKMGLEGKPTATVAGVELTQRLNALITEIGPYPHAALDPGFKIRKQSARMLKAACPDCGYTIRTAQKWLDVGLPTCPCGSEMETAK